MRDCRKDRKPPYAERHVRWCERSHGELIPMLLLDRQRKTVGQLAFLYVKVGVQSKGIGQSIWKAIETMHPEIEVWETCTPYFDRRNIHFYINLCGFHAVEFFNEHHPDPNMPRQPNEQREQSDVNISSAESRERKSEAQFDQEDGLFKFEKRMK